MWNDASGDFEQGLESLWEEKWGGVKSGGWGGGMHARASEQQNVLSAHYMPAGISSLSQD